MSHVDSALLERIARKAMADHGFVADFPPAAQAQANDVNGSDVAALDAGVRDMRDLQWTSIDNHESRDLDQIEVVEKVDGGTRLCVGIADVASTVTPDSPIDRYAGNNTTSVYTGVHTYTMLPARLSFDVTSLVEGQSRRVTVVDMVVNGQGDVIQAAVYRALTVNRAKLNYPAVSRWLDGGQGFEALDTEPELAAQLHLQDALAATLAVARKQAGALDLDTGETRPVFDAAGQVIDLAAHHQDKAGAIIEEFMIAANRSVVRALDAAGLPSLLRVVREPERWSSIVQYAAERGVELPVQPNALALSGFMRRMRQERTDEFHEISLAIVKLIGRGEYVARKAGDPPVGHFGLATDEYGHATAPNRRYADLVTQRLLFPLTGSGSSSYSFDELNWIAERCSLMENEAQKVERRVRKSIAAALLARRIGDTFDGVITKADGQGTFIHVFHPPVEGMVAKGSHGLRVGDKVHARLLRVDVERSWIDFTV